eukprot:2532278-Karenia_brevis.AAC.1
MRMDRMTPGLTQDLADSADPGCAKSRTGDGGPRHVIPYTKRESLSCTEPRSGKSVSELT